MSENARSAGERLHAVMIQMVPSIDVWEDCFPMEILDDVAIAFLQPHLDRIEQLRAYIARVEGRLAIIGEGKLTADEIERILHGIDPEIMKS